jgi:transposase
MLSLSHHCRYFLYRHPTDIRKSFDGLSGIIRNELAQNPLSGDVFIFVNKRRTHIKLLTFEGDGFALYYKRLEKGTYELPDSTAAQSVAITVSRLQLILSGVSLKNIKYRPRYQHNSGAAVSK